MATFYRKSDIPDDLRQYFCQSEIGAEPTPDEYVARLVAVFREVRRVLRDDGTCWVNLGDSYASSTGSSGASMKSTLATKPTATKTAAQREIGSWKRGMGDCKPKDLIGIPWRVAFALQADGWYLRQDIIWSKPNPMPESVRDRCTKSHEHVFLLSKSARYWFDADAINEPGTGRRSGKYTPDKTGAGKGFEIRSGFAKVGGVEWDTRNRRSVWTIASQAFSQSHFATMPPKLAELCIKAGCPEYTCPKCGTAIDSEIVSELRSGTNGNDLQSLSGGLSETAVGHGAKPVLQSDMRDRGEAAGDSAMPGMREPGATGPQESATDVLQQDMREPTHGEEQRKHEGLDHHIKGIPDADGKGASCGDQVRLRDGAPYCGRKDDRSIPGADGGGASQERRPSGQSAGEPASDDEEHSRPLIEGAASTRAHHMPALRQGRPPEQSCPHCGESLTYAALGRGLVLDPFAGAGTTGLVADRLQRSAVLIELNPAYADMARARIHGDCPLFAETGTEG